MLSIEISWPSRWVVIIKNLHVSVEDDFPSVKRTAQSQGLFSFTFEIRWAEMSVWENVQGRLLGFVLQRYLGSIMKGKIGVCP